MKDKIAKAIGIKYPINECNCQYQIIESIKEDGYTRELIKYPSADNDDIIAYLLIPDQVNNSPAILIHHQHNGERNLGKSEVCGLAGNSLQAFGVALVKMGFVVLAPDSICFEERRIGFNTKTIANENDYAQHFNHMCYLIVNGSNLGAKVLNDAIRSVSLLSSLPFVNQDKICTLGHSYGGNIVLFLAALDSRIKYSCVSGSGASYKERIKNNVGIEMASVIPGFTKKYDIDDLIKCVAPRRMTIISANLDKFSSDVASVVKKAQVAYEKLDAINNLTHQKFSGTHALTKERFDYIINWFKNEVL